MKKKTFCLHLFHSKDTRGFGNVLLNLGANIGIGGHGVGSPVAGLDQNLGQKYLVK